MSAKLNDAFFRALFHSQLGGIAVADIPSSSIIEINEVLLSILGCEREQIVGKPRAWLTFTPPEYHQLDEQAFQEVLERGYSEPFEKEYLRPDGRRIPVRVSSTIVQSYPELLIVYVNDISREKEAQQREDAFRQRLQIAVSAADQGVWDYDLRTGVMNYSKRAKEIYGLAADQPVTFDLIRDATHPDDLPHTLAQFSRAIDPEVRDRSSYDYRIIRPDGSIGWALAFGEAIFEGPPGAEKAVRYVGTLQDITERRRNEARFKAVFDSDLIGLAIFDAAHRVAETINDRYLHMTGHTRADFEEGRWDWRDFTIKEYLPLDEAAIRQAQERGWWDPYEKYYRSLDGHRWPVRISSAPLPGFPGKVVVSVEDISERKKWEEHQRLLIGELNHRVKNSLAVVQSIAHQTFPKDAAVQPFLGAFEKRLAALAATHNLLTRANWASANLHELVADGLKLHDWDQNRISIDGPDVALTPQAAVSLSMAVHELATNAVKYGAFSNDQGSVAIRWAVADTEFVFHWQEHGGPPVKSPTHRGFGSRMIERALSSALDGHAELRFEPEGLQCVITAPEAILAPSA